MPQNEHRTPARSDIPPSPPRRSRVVVYSAAGCSLCERALAVVREVCGDEFELIAIDGVPELEARYRQWLPVVEVDGEGAFDFFVEPEALRRRLERG